jgi:cytochrome c oxidase subunit 2
MQFRVVADSPETFASWLDGQRQPAVALTSGSVEQRGEQVFFGSACVYCHAVRGTAALSGFGPDLTHLGSRETLASGVLENNRGNPAAWIIDPQSIKPGNAMPGVSLSGEDLEALVAYLESLD